jgi:hypothetical protein
MFAGMLAIDIDGARIEPNFVVALHQKRPFPGGHRYRLRAEEPRLGERSALPLGSHSRFSEAETNSLFLLLSILLEKVHRVDRRPAAFLVNSIETATVTRDSVEVEGVCSPFVASPESAPTSSGQS